MNKKIIPFLETIPIDELVKFNKNSGSITIRSKVDLPKLRMNYEKLMLPGIKVGLEGWQRSHAQGAGTGHKSRLGIFYAPKEVNQKLLNNGVEELIRTFEKTKPNHIIFILTTSVSSHKKIEQNRLIETNRLKEIIHVLQAKNIHTNRIDTIFEAWIEVDDTPKNPRITNGVSYASPTFFTLN